MKMRYVALVMLVMLSVAWPGYGMGQEAWGPDSDRGHPTTEQTDWPTGIAEVPRHDSRVYSWWVNGNEHFFFDANPDEVNELIGRFSKARMRDYEIWLKPGKGETKSFDRKTVGYNVELQIVAGIVGYVKKEEAPAETHEPVLTVYVDPDGDGGLLDELRIPDNIILHNEVPGSTLSAEATKPKRSVWYAQVQFEEGSPAVDFDHGVQTYATLWEKDIEDGIKLGRIDRNGYFSAALSEWEIADLKTANAWITLTVGNWATKPTRHDPWLDVEYLTQDKDSAQPATVAKPALLYGRLLFDDGSPATLNPLPWPGAEIQIHFPFTGSATPAADGYIQVYLSPDQLETIKADKARKNVYVPSYEREGSSTALHVFPVSKLSPNKDEAGVVRIPNPAPK